MKRVTTRICWDIATWQVLEHEYYDYSGTWELCKGEQAQANQIAQQQLNLQKQAFQLEQNQIGQINAFAAPYMTPQGIGFTPQQMALLNSQSANTVNQGYNSAAQNVRSVLGARGEGLGNLPLGAPAIQGFSGLEGARASDLASAFRTNQLANLQQALTNKFNAASLMAGQTPNFTNNAGQFGAGASNALGSAVNAGRYGFMGAFSPTLGQLTGQTVSTLGRVGLAGLLSNLSNKGPSPIDVSGGFGTDWLNNVGTGSLASVAGVGSLLGDSGNFGALLGSNGFSSGGFVGTGF